MNENDHLKNEIKLNQLIEKVEQQQKLTDKQEKDFLKFKNYVYEYIARISNDQDICNFCGAIHKIEDCDSEAAHCYLKCKSEQESL